MLMVDLLGMLLVQGPSRCPLRAQWPLHRALADLNLAVANTDLAGSLPPFSFKADAVVGVVEQGAVMGLHELVANGFMGIAGDGWNAALEVTDQKQLHAYRRMLMGLDPRLAGLTYQGGSNWAARAVAAEKNWDKPRA